MRLVNRWKQKARELEREVYALYLACRDPRVPWYAKALALGVVGYAFSPIDLIPDPIPILGYLDDLVLVPLGILAVRALIPAPILAECRERARSLPRMRPNWVAASVIITIWVVLAAVAVLWIIRHLRL